MWDIIPIDVPQDMKYGEIMMIPNSNETTIRIYGGDQTLFKFNLAANDISAEDNPQLEYDNFKSVPIFHCGRSIFAGEE
jgi:folate-binding Fe-S cluster repair protein YgfZ